MVAESKINIDEVKGVLNEVEIKRTAIWMNMSTDEILMVLAPRETRRIKCTAEKRITNRVADQTTLDHARAASTIPAVRKPLNHRSH